MPFFFEQLEDHLPGSGILRIGKGNFQAGTSKVIDALYALGIAFLNHKNRCYETNLDIILQSVGISGIIKERVMGNENITLSTSLDVG